MSQIKNGSRDSLDPRAQRTRRLLLDAFGALMRERSYGRITVGDIAARATVNRATFYLHFRDKDALLEEVLRERTRERLDLAAPVPPWHDPAYLQVLLVGVCEFLARMDRECPGRTSSSTGGWRLTCRRTYGHGSPHGSRSAAQPRLAQRP